MGRDLVELYYEYSPGIAKKIHYRPELRESVRMILTPFYWMSIPAERLGGVSGFVLFIGIFIFGILALCLLSLLTFRIFSSENKKVRVSIFLLMLFASGFVLKPVFAQDDYEEHGAIGGPGEDMAVQPAMEAPMPPPDSPVTNTDFGSFGNDDNDSDYEPSENSLGGFGETTGDQYKGAASRAEAYRRLKERETREPHWLPNVKRENSAKLKFDEVKGKRTKSISVLHEELGEEINSGFNISFTTAPVKPTLSGAAKANDFDAVYSNERFGAFFGFDKNIGRGDWGTFGWQATGGVTYSRGYGRFSDGEEMRRFSFRFWTFPLSLGVTYRFHPLKYVVPYVEAGGLGYVYRETRDDKVNDVKSGLSYGSRLSAGLQIALDWINFSQS
jgi:hypothetical protein